MSNIRIKLLDSANSIENKIGASSTKELRQLFQKAKPKIESGIKNLVVASLLSCPEIKSLQSGKLKFDFGLVIDPTSEIVYSIANTTHVIIKNFKVSKSVITNALTIYIQPSDFKNLLSNPFANTLTERGDSLPWLKWLLVEGDAIIINNYSVEYGPYINSRSGGAIMIPSIGVFKVDSAFSGTTENNFITRALENKENEILDIIRGAI